MATKFSRYPSRHLSSQPFHWIALKTAIFGSLIGLDHLFVPFSDINMFFVALQCFLWDLCLGAPPPLISSFPARNAISLNYYYFFSSFLFL